MYRKMFLGLVLVLSFAGIASASTWWARYGHSTWTDLAPSNPTQCLSTAESETDALFCDTDAIRSAAIDRRAGAWDEWYNLEIKLQILDEAINLFGPLNSEQEAVYSTIVGIYWQYQGYFDVQSSGTGRETTEEIGGGLWFGDTYSPEFWERSNEAIAYTYANFLTEKNSNHLYSTKCTYYDGTTCQNLYNAKTQFAAYEALWLNAASTCAAGQTLAAILFEEIVP